MVSLHLILLRTAGFSVVKKEMILAQTGWELRKIVF